MPFRSSKKDPVRIRYEVRAEGLNSTISFLTALAPFNAIEVFKHDYRCITMDLRNANGGQCCGPLEVVRPWDALPTIDLA